jgi:hypothetical protein
LKDLRLRRNRLIGPYIGFVLMFVSCGAMAGTGQVHSQLGMVLGLLLVLSLPVIVLNVSLHAAIKRVVPTAGSAGLKQTLVSSLLFTPIEAALVLPAINLTIATRILRGGGPPQNKVQESLRSDVLPAAPRQPDRRCERRCVTSR